VHADIAQLVGAAPIAIVDPSVASAGADSRTALERLGLWEAMQSHSLGVVSTADAAFLLTTGKARFAVVYCNRCRCRSRAFRGRELPDDADHAIEYWVAETVAVRSPESAKFLAFLGQSQAKDQLRADGLEVPR